MKLGVGIGLDYIRTAGGFSSEYQSVYDALITKSSAAIAKEQDIMVKTMVDAGTWIKRDAIYIHAQQYNTGGEALLDWKQPTGIEIGFDSALINSGFPYDQFTAVGLNGCDVVADGGSLEIAGTVDELDIVAGKTYRLTFDLTLNSGAKPDGVRFAASLGGSTWSSTIAPIEGANDHLLVATNTGIGVLQFYTSSKVGDFEIRNLVIKEWTNATAFNAPIFTSLEGLAGDGASAYIDYNIRMDLLSLYSQDDASVAVYIRNNVDEAKHVLGVNDGSNFLQFAPRNSGNAEWSINDNGTDDTGANTDSRGYFDLNRTASNARAAHRNNVELASDTQVSTGLPAKNLYGLASNNNGAGANFCTYQIAALLVGGQLTSDERTAEKDAIETYMDSNEKGIIS